MTRNVHGHRGLPEFCCMAREIVNNPHCFGFALASGFLAAADDEISKGTEVTDMFIEMSSRK